MIKNIIVASLVALVVSAGVGFTSQNDKVSGLSERDIQAISLKVGSARDTNFVVPATGATVSVGSSTPTTLGNVVVDGTGTTTLLMNSSTASRGSCIQMETVTGGTVAITVTGTTIAAVAGNCK